MAILNGVKSNCLVTSNVLGDAAAPPGGFQSIHGAKEDK